MNSNLKYSFLSLLLAFLLFFLYLYHFDAKPSSEGSKTSDTVLINDTIYKVNILKIEKLVPQKIVEIKRDTLYKKDSTEVILVTENKEYKDTISTDDGDSIILNSFVSGINSKLDSTKLSLKKKEIIKTIEITKYINKKETIWDKFNLGIGIGYGIGLRNKDFEPFVGFSLTYNL